MDSSSSIRAHIAAEADEWLLKLQSEGEDCHRQAFTDWLMQSPAHIEAYLAVSRTWHELSVPREGKYSQAQLIQSAAAEPEASNVIALHAMEAAQADGNSSSSSRFPWRSLAAAALLAGTASFWLFQHGASDSLRTSVGEQRSVTLADGSVVFLNTNSELKVRFTQAERHIDLSRGEARFQVAKNPNRPFIVATPQATVRAVGTVFNVRTGENSTEVAVLEGRVDVNMAGKGQAAATPEMLLSAGQRAAVGTQGVRSDEGAPLERVAAWTERRLVFRGEPLSAVVAEFNRYRLKALTVDDAGLAGIRINGVFDLNDPDSFIAYLRSFESVQVKKLSDGSEHLTRASR